MRHRTAAAGTVCKAFGSGKTRGGTGVAAGSRGKSLWKRWRYFTSFSNGRRRWPGGGFWSCDFRDGTSTGDIASHNAFNSKSAT
jgi:hypothetical protein